MIIYMLRNPDGLYYTKSWAKWVEQERGKVFSRKCTASLVKNKYAEEECEIIDYLMIEKNCPDCRGEKLLAKLKEWGID